MRYGNEVGNGYIKAKPTYLSGFHGDPPGIATLYDKPFIIRE